MKKKNLIKRGKSLILIMIKRNRKKLKLMKIKSNMNWQRVWWRRKINTNTKLWIIKKELIKKKLKNYNKKQKKLNNKPFDHTIVSILYLEKFINIFIIFE